VLASLRVSHPISVEAMNYVLTFSANIVSCPCIKGYTQNQCVLIMSVFYNNCLYLAPFFPVSCANLFLLYFFFLVSFLFMYSRLKLTSYQFFPCDALLAQYIL